MPELPEAETLAQDIDAAARGRIVASVDVVRPDVLRVTGPTALKRRVTGARIERVWRRAKAVVIDFSGGQHLVIGLGFTGGLAVEPPGTGPDPYDTLRFRLRGGGTLVCRDVRRLGRLTLMDERAFAAYDRRIGMEPLGPHFTAEALSGFIRGSSQAIKKLIMDQGRLAGVGNIYANEALWTTRIDPSRAGTRVTDEEAASLRDAIVDVLGRAIAARGTTFRDFRDGRGRKGAFVFQLNVYGREGEPCRRCGTRLTFTHAVDGRATVFCHRCQR